MPYAVRIHRPGDPSALQVERMEESTPAAGEVLLRQTAIGLNFIDTYHRSGLYPLPAYPATLGREAVGVIEAVGAAVTGFQTGDRVGYPLHPGAYTDFRAIDAGVLIRIPDAVPDEVAAAAMLKGLTAWYLLHKTYAVRPGETILFHAVAGGVGSIACQWAGLLGATVIGTVGSAEKAERAKQLGCDHVVQYDEEDFCQTVREVTGGAGVPVVYDSVGRDTFDASLDSLAPRGLMVSFGQSSGPVEPFVPGMLAKKGSLYLTRPSLVDYLRDPLEKAEGAKALFDRIASGEIRIDIGRRYPLQDARQAHEDLEARRTQGSTILIP